MRGDFEEISQQSMPELGFDAFRVKLYAEHGMMAMREAHYYTIRRFGGYSEAFGERVAVNDQGVVTRSYKRILQPVENPFAFVSNVARLAVH